MTNFSISHNVFYSDNFTPFVHIFDIIFLFDAKLEEPKIGIWDKWLITSAKSIDSGQVSVHSISRLKIFLLQVNFLMSKE